MPAEAEVFSRPGATALNRTREKPLNDLARNASDESKRGLDRGHVAVAFAGHRGGRDRNRDDRGVRVEQILQRIADGDERKAGNIDRLQKGLFRRFVERLHARRIVGEGDGMQQPVEFIAPPGEFLRKPGDFFFAFDVANENLLAAGEFFHARAEFFILHHINALRPRLDQHAAHVPRHAFLVGHAEEEDLFVFELKEGHGKGLGARDQGLGNLRKK